MKEGGERDYSTTHFMLCFPKDLNFKRGLFFTSQPRNHSVTTLSPQCSETVSKKN